MTDVPRPVVLVVEDDAVNRRLLAEICRTEGYEVETADDGDAAYDSFRSRRVDLILMDASMPGMDGFAVCRLVRKESGVPIIMLSASTEPSVRQRAAEAGATSFVAKPFRVYDLVRHMRSALVAHRSPSEPPTSVRRSQRRMAASALGRVAGAVDLRMKLRKEVEGAGRERACVFIRVANERDLTREQGRHAAEAVLGAVSKKLVEAIGEESVFWSESNELVGVMEADRLEEALGAARSARAGWKDLQVEGVMVRMGAIRYHPGPQLDVDYLLREGRLAAGARSWDEEPIEVRRVSVGQPTSSHP